MNCSPNSEIQVLTQCQKLIAILEADQREIDFQSIPNSLLLQKVVFSIFSEAEVIGSLKEIVGGSFNPPASILFPNASRGRGMIQRGGSRGQLRGALRGTRSVRGLLPQIRGRGRAVLIPGQTNQVLS